MKPAHEWNWEYIQTLPIGEFERLECKGLGGPPGQVPKIDENKVREMLAKALSALANTGGGKFLWGVKDPDDAQGWYIENGGIPASHKGSTAEWLKNVISPLTDPPLMGFDVYTITGIDDLREDHAVYVIDVKDSPLAPHQHANDKRYYGRVGGNSQPLGHRLVMDIMGRRQNPQLSFYYQTGAEINQLNSIPEHRGEYTIYLDIGIRNEGRVTARYPALEIPNPSPHAHFVFRDKRRGANQHTGYGLPRKVPGRNDNFTIYSGGADDILFPNQTIEVARYELNIDGVDAVKIGKINFPFKIYAEGFQTESVVEVLLEPVLRKANRFFNV